MTKAAIKIKTEYIYKKIIINVSNSIIIVYNNMKITDTKTHKRLNIKQTKGHVKYQFIQVRIRCNVFFSFCKIKGSYADFRNKVFLTKGSNALYTVTLELSLRYCAHV